MSLRNKLLMCGKIHEQAIDLLNIESSKFFTTWTTSDKFWNNESFQMVPQAKFQLYTCKTDRDV